MTDPEETLSAIDAAIEGWSGYDGTVSRDAMRWAPEMPARRRREVTATLTPAQERALRTWAQAWTEQVRRQHAGITRAFQRLHSHLLKTAERAHSGFAPLTYGDAYGKHRRRCRSCNPAGNPKPLKVNGADYARRRKNRRRRRGR